MLLELAGSTNEKVAEGGVEERGWLVKWQRHKRMFEKGETISHYNNITWRCVKRSQSVLVVPKALM